MERINAGINSNKKTNDEGRRQMGGEMKEINLISTDYVIRKP